MNSKLEQEVKDGGCAGIQERALSLAPSKKGPSELLTIFLISSSYLTHPLVWLRSFCLVFPLCLLARWNEVMSEQVLCECWNIFWALGVTVFVFSTHDIQTKSSKVCALHFPMHSDFPVTSMLPGSKDLAFVESNINVQGGLTKHGSTWQS